MLIAVHRPIQKDVPQFVVFTADDAIQSYTLDAVNQFLAHRKNPNGCQPKMTYFTSLNYTNYTLVTDWYVRGNEIAVRPPLLPCRHARSDPGPATRTTRTSYPRGSLSPQHTHAHVQDDPRREPR